MAELGNALAVVLAVNVVLWLGQVAVTELNPTGPVFYNCQDSIIGEFEANNCQGNQYVIDDENPAADLPSSGSQVQVDNGNFFTDTFSSAVNWFTQSTGLKYLYSMLAAPSNILKAIGVPPVFAFGVGVLWYGFTLFLIIAFVLGRDY